MTRSILSLAAGKSERFDGTPKHQLIVNGETLEDRTQKLFGNVRFITRSLMPDTICTCDTLIKSRVFWGNENIILLGDVWYTELARDQILQFDTELGFFTDTQDIFAIKFRAPWVVPIMHLGLRAIETKHNNGRLWELYRTILGLPISTGLPHGKMLCIDIADQTQDFDEPEELENFKRGVFKNKLFTAGVNSHR